MKLGLIGLGRMGNAIAHRVLESEYEVIGFDINKEALGNAKKMGVKVVSSIMDVAKKTQIIWLMLPDKIVDSVIEQLIPHLKTGAILIDGGNSNFKHSKTRADALQRLGVCFLDCGTSGGLHGRDIGFSLMVGGKKEAYEKIVSLLTVIAAPEGFGYMGPSGSGHYVKMIHNGIEYGLLQAYSEGFHLLREGCYKNLDLEKISRVWLHGSIIRSWILQLAHDIFKEGQTFDDVMGEIAEGGTGRWMVEEGKEQFIPLPVIEESLKIRKWSRDSGGNYATKLVALLRNKFGGHEIKKN